MARRSKEDAKKTRESILASALAMFAEKGYEHTTFTDIAARLKMTKGAVYWHFESKQNLLIALVDEMLEKFKAQNKGESQMMLMPVSVNLTADEYSAITENFDLMESAGYEVSDFGDRCVKVSACPPELVNENINEIIIEIAGYLSKNIKTVMPEKLDWILHSMACRAAVKAGNFTSSYEAEKFVGTLLANKEIRFCPHGRPVMVEMTKRELEKQFGRIQ